MTAENASGLLAEDDGSARVWCLGYGQHQASFNTDSSSDKGPVERVMFTFDEMGLPISRCAL